MGIKRINSIMLAVAVRGSKPKDVLLNFELFVLLCGKKVVS